MTLERKSPTKAAIELTVVLKAAMGEDRFNLDMEEVILECTKRYDDPIDKVVGASLGRFEGMLAPSRKKPCWRIVYNNDTKYRGRERFTLAHELGHYVLHRHPLKASDFMGGFDEAAAEERSFSCNPLERNLWRKAEENIEEEADTFASYLLMPIDDYREQVADHPMSIELLRHITKRYGVSLTAAIRKWLEFTDKRAALVVSRDGFALWGRASKPAYKSGVFVRQGMAVPELSVAGRGPTAQGENPGLPVELPEGVWRFARGTEPVRELTIFSDRLGKTLSILLFDDAPDLRFGK